MTRKKHFRYSTCFHFLDILKSLSTRVIVGLQREECVMNHLSRVLSKSSIRILALGATEPKPVAARRLSGQTMSTCPVYSANYIENRLKKDLEAEHVEVVDLSGCCGMKFDAVIVSPKFDGKPILQRQRLVNQTLAEEMKYIHAFTMRTLTPTQWTSQKKESTQ